MAVLLFHQDDNSALIHQQHWKDNNNNNNNNKQTFQRRTINGIATKGARGDTETKPNAYTSTFSVNA